MRGGGEAEEDASPGRGELSAGTVVGSVFVFGASAFSSDASDASKPFASGVRRASPSPAAFFAGSDDEPAASGLAASAFASSSAGRASSSRLSSKPPKRRGGRGALAAAGDEGGLGRTSDATRSSTLEGAFVPTGAGAFVPTGASEAPEAEAADDNDEKKE